MVPLKSLWANSTRVYFPAPQCFSAGTVERQIALTHLNRVFENARSAVLPGHDLSVVEVDFPNETVKQRIATPMPEFQAVQLTSRKVRGGPRPAIL